MPYLQNKWWKSAKPVGSMPLDYYIFQIKNNSIQRLSFNIKSNTPDPTSTIPLSLQLFNSQWKYLIPIYPNKISLDLIQFAQLFKPHRHKRTLMISPFLWETSRVISRKKETPWILCPFGYDDRVIPIPFFFFSYPRQG